MRGTEFEPGPRGRPSPDGGPPRCTNCGSLERHRALRRAFMPIPPPLLAWRRVLQFAPDSSLVTGDDTHKLCFLCRRRADAETLAAAFEAEAPSSIETYAPVPG